MKLPAGYVVGVGVHKATAYGGIGEKLLKGMGWQDGRGLGRDMNGMKKAIEVKQKDDVIGVSPRNLVDRDCFDMHPSRIHDAPCCTQFSSTSENTSP